MAGLLQSQLHDLTHGGTGSIVYNSVALVKLADARQIFSREKETIESSAQQLHIVLKLGLDTSVPEVILAETARAPFKTSLKLVTSRSILRTTPTARVED